MQKEVGRLRAAEGIVLCFDHADDLGPIRPGLRKLRKVLAVTSLGTLWRADRFVMHRPVKRVLKKAILGACAPDAELKLLSLYKAERLEAGQVRRFAEKVERALAVWR